MAANFPIVKQIAWKGLIPQMIVVVTLMWLAEIVGIKESIPVGAIAYLILSVGLKWLIPHLHRKGIALVKKGRFAEALTEFERSFAFFTAHKRLDDWRAVTILSPSRMSYREMGLLNMAFCCSQIGRHAEALNYYQQVSKEYPGNHIAESALRMMNASSANEQLQPS
ncbi:MAG: tetratricopeptide repeat protein [Luteolibacter sp.]